MSQHEPTPTESAQIEALAATLIETVDDMLRNAVQTREVLAAHRDEARDE